MTSCLYSIRLRSYSVYEIGRYLNGQNISNVSEHCFIHSHKLGNRHSNSKFQDTQPFSSSGK